MSGYAPAMTPRGELERGITCAWQEHYSDAALHFASARDQLVGTHPQLVVALDAFIQSHARYWQAEQALHQATHLFSTASVEQQSRLDELERLLAAAVQLDLHEPAAASPPVEVDEEDDEAEEGSESDAQLPPLSITLFGRFAVWDGGQQVALCRNRNGQAILRYLAAHPYHRETADVLMEALWPEDSPDVAQHKLHVAVSALRKALNRDLACRKGGGYLVFENGAYQLNPAARLTIDADQFLALYRAGQRAGGAVAVSHYEAACRLHTGTFLPEDIYADWPSLRREQLTQVYLSMCHALAAHYTDLERYDDAIVWATAILEENRCDEEAYRLLIRACAAQGHRAEAQRHYRRCEQALAQELGVEPMPETVELFHALVHPDHRPEPEDRATAAGTRGSHLRPLPRVEPE